MSEPRQVVSAPGGDERSSRRRKFVLAAAVLALSAVAAGAVVSLFVGGTSGQRPSRRNTVASGHLVLPHRGAQPAGALARLEAIGYSQIRQLTRLGLPIYCGGRRGNEVAFTFDDGPGPYTYLALRKLRQAGERATFFDVGRSSRIFPGWLRPELALGAIGDHTYTHPDLQLLSDGQIVSQIVATRNALESQTRQRVYLFRPPYGARDARVDRLVKRLGLLDVMWSMDSRDSIGAYWRGVVRNVEAGLHPGAIILMHENHGQTIRALATLLLALHRRHLRSVSLPELFASDSPSVAQVRKGLYGCGPLHPPPVLTGG
jgi:peptidoglycan-N-acetylglucosamine deacetylase